MMTVGLKKLDFNLFEILNNYQMATAYVELCK